MFPPCLVKSHLTIHLGTLETKFMVQVAKHHVSHYRLNLDYLDQTNMRITLNMTLELNKQIFYMCYCY